MLDETARLHPNTWWWIKADGVDLVSGLGESVRGEWSGDVDLNNGNFSKCTWLTINGLILLIVLMVKKKEIFSV